MFVVTGFIGSPYGRAVLATLIEKGAPYRLAPMRPGQHRTAEYLARHPFGRVPTIEHEGFELYETQAILRYIDRVVQSPPLTPADPRAAARMDRAMNCTDWYYFRIVAAPVVFGRVVAPRLGLPIDEAEIAAALPAARACVAGMETLMGEGPYVAGDEFSLADLHLWPHIDMLSECAEGQAMLAGTKLADWHARLAGRPCFQRTTWDALLAAAA